MTYKNDLYRYSENNSVINDNQNIFYSSEADANLSLLRMERSGLISRDSVGLKRR